MPKSPRRNRFVERRTCPACDAAGSSTIYDAPYQEPPLSTYLIDFYGEEQGQAMVSELEGVRFVLRECPVCALVYQHHAPDDETVRLLYDRWIDADEALERDRAQGVGPSTENVQELLQIISAIGRPPASLRVLDFGMGWGRWLQAARALGCEVAGSEVSEARLAYAERLGLPVVSWDEIPDGGFDLINSEQVFEHLVDPIGVGRHLASGLAPGGVLKICVPNGADIHRRLRAMDWTAPKFTRNSLNDVAPLEHLNCFAPRSLAALGRQMGLEPFLIPLSSYYRYAFPWAGPVHFAKQLVKPLYRNLGHRGAYVLFRAPGQGELTADQR